MITIREKLGLDFGVRHLQVFLLFLCTAISYFIRVNVSVAVVAMTNKNTTNPDFEEFDWNIQDRSYILSSFYWGYAITQLPGGYIAQKYGAKYVLLASVAVPSLLCVITPISVSYGGWEVFCAIRVTQGFFQGFIFPALHSLLPKWAPLEERNRLGIICHSGVEVGTVLAFGASGFIAASYLGWPGISYISGGVGLLWSIVWYFLSANNPSESKIITANERQYIESSLKQTNTAYKNIKPTPWLKIWTSVPYLSLICVAFGNTWGFLILLHQLPSYLHNILKMNIENNAIYSAIPYLVVVIVLYTSMFLADYLSRNKLLTLTMIRKSFSATSMWIPGIGLIVIGFVGSHDNIVVTVILLTTVVGGQGCFTMGCLLNHIDLSPNYSGVLMGITNTFATAVAIMSPISVGLIISDMENLNQWQIIFSIAGTFMILSNLVYLIFGKMEPQPWNFDTNEMKIKNCESQLPKCPENIIKEK